MDALRAIREQKANINRKSIQLTSQIKENELVLNQLNSLESGDMVYKLTGPVLVSQEPDDGVRVVEQRLNFLRAEHDKVSTKATQLLEKEALLVRSLSTTPKT